MDLKILLKPKKKRKSQHIKTWYNLKFMFTVITEEKHHSKPAVAIYKGI